MPPISPIRNLGQFSDWVSADDLPSAGAFTLLVIDSSGNVATGADLPTSDPGVAGALWNNGGVLTLSAGAVLGIGSMVIGSSFIVS